MACQSIVLKLERRNKLNKRQCRCSGNFDTRAAASTRLNDCIGPQALEPVFKAVDSGSAPGFGVAATMLTLVKFSGLTLLVQSGEDLRAHLYGSTLFAIVSSLLSR